MEQAIRPSVPTELIEPAVPGVSWAAVAAGAVASLALITTIIITITAMRGAPWSS